jgi:hypothetical protein
LLEITDLRQALSYTIWAGIGSEANCAPLRKPETGRTI